MRGQFRGYREEPGVAPDSHGRDFAAVRLHIDSWRWAGVPFFIRAGKCLPVTRTEVVVEAAPPAGRSSRDVHAPREPPPLPARAPTSSSRSARQAKAPGRDHGRRGRSSSTWPTPGPATSDPYERLLGDAMRGDSFRFARQDYVEEAWRCRSRDPGEHANPRVRAGDLGAEGGRALVPGGWFLATS